MVSRSFIPLIEKSRNADVFSPVLIIRSFPFKSLKLPEICPETETSWFIPCNAGTNSAISGKLIFELEIRTSKLTSEKSGFPSVLKKTETSESLADDCWVRRFK